MITTLDIKRFIESSNYLSLIEKINNSINIDINMDTPPSASLNIYTDYLKKSNLKISDIETLILDEIPQEFITFLNSCLESEPNYFYEGYEDEEIKLPFYKDFLISYLIKFSLLKNKREEIFQYLNKIKSPYIDKEFLFLENAYIKAHQ